MAGLAAAFGLAAAESSGGARSSWGKITTAATAVSVLRGTADPYADSDLKLDEEDEVDHLRRFLTDHFGSKHAAFKALDDNGNGQLSMNELHSALGRHHISLQDACGTGDLRKVFKMMDIDGSGEISMKELMEVDRATRREAVRKLALRRRRPMAEKLPEKKVDEGPYVDPKYHDEVEQAVEHMREFLCKRFGSAKAAFRALDTNGNGDLSFGELTSSLDRMHISSYEITGGVDLKKVFNDLDYNKSSELSFYELMVCDWETRHGVKEKKIKVVAPKKTKDDDWDPYDSKLAKKRRGAINPLHEEEDVVFDEMCDWMKKIAKFAKDEGQIELDLKMCFIGEKGAKMLAAAIRKPGRMRQVKVMQLYGNYITSPGVIAIAEVLEKYCWLQKLNLGWNGIGDEGAIRLSTTIVRIAAMVDLNLAHNRIGNNGAKAIARALTKKPSLETLDLQNNSIGPQGLEKLSKARYQGLTMHVENNAYGSAGLKGKFKEQSFKEALGEVANGQLKASESTLGPHSLPLAKIKKSDGDSDASSTRTPPSPPQTPTTAGPSVQSSTGSLGLESLSSLGQSEGSWATRVLPRSPAMDAAFAAGVSNAWDCDPGHPLRRPRTPQRPSSQASMRRMDQTPLAEVARRPLPGGKGMVGENWPAAMQLSKALSDAKLAGQGQLPRPTSQGGLRKKRNNSKTQMPPKLEPH